MPTKPDTHGQRLRRMLPMKHTTWENRPNAADRGYDARWRRYRRWYLARHPLCEHCKAIGRITVAKVADHIVPLRQGGAHCSQANTQSLCQACHNRKTARERGPGQG